MPIHRRLALRAERALLRPPVQACAVEEVAAPGDDAGEVQGRCGGGAGEVQGEVQGRCEGDRDLWKRCRAHDSVESCASSCARVSSKQMAQVPSAVRPVRLSTPRKASPCRPPFSSSMLTRLARITRSCEVSPAWRASPSASSKKPLASARSGAMAPKFVRTPESARCPSRTLPGPLACSSESRRSLTAASCCRCLPY